MVMGFTENVKIVGRNNAIHHFDTCGLSIFLQIHFLHGILLYLRVLCTSKENCCLLLTFASNLDQG